MAAEADKERSEETVIPPGSTIGILGGGQLGRMLAVAAAELGYHAHVYCPDPDSPAFEVAKFHTIADYEDASALRKFAASVDVITYEFENIPAAPLSVLGNKLRPGVKILSLCQHRVREKKLLKKLGIPTAPFVAVNNDKEYQAAIKQIGLPAVLKTTCLGYDGKGQWKIKHKPKLNRHPGESRDQEPHGVLPEIPQQVRNDKKEFILEGFVDFRMEISVIVARGADGKMKCYSPVQNIHKNHILSETIAPAPISPALAKKAEAIARKIAEGLGLVGLLAVEMFVTKDNELLVNELAPRPHNSGHWTIDACAASQFEQCVRAICGLPLASPGCLCGARMVNLIGDDIESWPKWLKKPDARVHLYGKKESRPGRKMGHVTMLED